MSKKRRTEAVSVQFENRQAKGWVFGVSDAFRMNLDIRLDQRIDKEANKAKEAKLGRKLEPSEKQTRLVWTEGNPPAYSFDRGHVFHEPPECHLLPWSDALPLLRRSMVVVRAKPDAGALIELHVADIDAEGDEATTVQELDVEASGSGWVDYEVLTYEKGVLVGKEAQSSTQAAFVELLRSGRKSQAAVLASSENYAAPSEEGRTVGCPLPV